MIRKLMDEYYGVFMELGILLIAITILGYLSMLCFGLASYYGVEMLFMGFMIFVMLVIIVDFQIKNIKKEIEEAESK